MAKEIDIYEASDYAGLKAGGYDFYYGYEVIYCPKHSYAGIQESPHCAHDNNADNECDNDTEWCFTARKDGEIFASYIQSDLETLIKNEDNTSEYILAGIATMLKEKKLIKN